MTARSKSAFREAVKNDRARVQIGKISQFGLMEMSRQRLRAGVVAGSTVTCPHCAGAGIVRSVESTALRLLRTLEEEGEKSKSAAVLVKVASDIAIYVLNQKRHELSRIEGEHAMAISFVTKDDLPAGQFEIERTKSRDPSERPRNHHAVSIEAGFVPSDEPDYVEEAIEEDEEIEEIEDEAPEAEASAISEDGERHPNGDDEQEAGREGGREGGRKRRRRGGRGRNRDRRPDALRSENPRPDADRAAPANEAPQIEGGEVSVDQDRPTPGQPTAEGGEGRRRRRRRGRRGGRDRADRPHDQPRETVVQDRFGAPDEIDTTPSASRVAPNSPSAPV